METKSQEIARLKQWVKDLQSKMYINCVYCGHRYGPSDEEASDMQQALQTHIESCPHHPMSELKRENKKLKERISQLLHALNPEQNLYEDGK